MKQQIVCSLVSIVLVLVVSACSSPKVRVPPRVDLGGYGTLGLVVFDSNATGTLDAYASQRFLQTVYAAQPGVRVIELGDELRVLESVGHDELDFEAIRAIGEKWQVDAVFIGHLEVTDVKPNFDLSTMVKTLSMSADVKVNLQVRLLETARGATVWTRGANAAAPVAHVKVVSRGPVDFGATDPDEAYGKLVQSLVGRVTQDFWARWESQ